jgi:hypothetical protein
VKTGRRAVIELLLALVAAVGCVLSWLASISTVDVPPIIDNEPWTTSLIYSPPLLALSLLLATVAGVLAVLGVARLRRPRVAPEQFSPPAGEAAAVARTPVP